MRIRDIAIGIFALLIPSVCSAIPADPTVYYFVTTGHTGAQVQLDINHTSTWIFNPVKDFYFGGGKFILKDGSSMKKLPSNANGTTVKIWEGSNQALPLFQMYLTNAQFVAAKAPENDQSFGTIPVQYLVSGAVTLLAGHQYTITLSSPVPDKASMQYFIKDPTEVGFYDKDNNLIPNPPPMSYNGPPPPLGGIPEPGAAALVAGGIALLALALRGRFHQRRANMLCRYPGTKGTVA